MSPFLSFVRRLKPLDLLLPVGAALVTYGLQSLAERETRQRERLAQLAELAADHVQALMNAGAAVPAELAGDEEHPLDPNVPWLMQHAPAPDDEQDAPASGRGWKLTAVALAAGTVIAFNHRDELRAAASKFGFTMPWPPAPAALDDEVYPHNSWCNTKHEPGPDQCPPPVGPADYTAVGGEPVDVMCLVPHCGLHRHPDDVEHVFRFGADLTPSTSLEICGWPNCGYEVNPELSDQDQVLALAVHRNQCFYRPSGAHVPGE